MPHADALLARLTVRAAAYRQTLAGARMLPGRGTCRVSDAQTSWPLSDAQRYSIDPHRRVVAHKLPHALGNAMAPSQATAHVRIFPVVKAWDMCSHQQLLQAL